MHKNSDQRCILVDGNMQQIAIALFLLLTGILALSACSSGGGSDSGSSSKPASLIVQGQVLAPSSQLSVLSTPSTLDRVFNVLLPKAYAELGGLVPVDDGTEVTLIKVNDAGSIDTELATTITFQGRYSFDLTALKLGLSSELMVVVSGKGVQMRAFVTETTVDITPQSESLARLVFDEIAVITGSQLNHFTNTEINNLKAGLDLLTSIRTMTTSANIEDTVNAIMSEAKLDNHLTDYLNSAIAAGQTEHGIGDVAELYPLGQADTWNYLVENLGDTVPYFSHIKITGNKLIGAVNTTVATEFNSDNTNEEQEYYYEKTTNAVLNHGSNDAQDFVTSQLAPYTEIQFPLTLGQSYTPINATNLEWREDLDEDGANERFSISATVTNTGIEPIETPYLRFPATLRMDLQLDIVLTLSGDGTKVSVTGNESQWIAPEVGAVKLTTERTIQGPGGDIVESNSHEISGYRVGGIGKGILPQFSIATSLTQANSDTTTPGRAAVGWDGSQYLVVTCREAVNGSPSGMIGNFVNIQGEVTQSFTIASHACFSFSADVAFDGSNYFIVFQRYDGGTFGSPGVFGIRVSPTGEVLDAGDGLALSTGTETTFHPKVAFDGTNFLVVYGKYLDTNLWDVWGTRVSTDGVILNEFSVMAASGDQNDPDISFDGSNFLVVWEHTAMGSSPALSTDVMATRITPAGVVLDTSGIPIATAANYQGDAKISFDGENYLVVWRDADNLGLVPPEGAIYGRRITPMGVLLDGTADSSGIVINPNIRSRGDLAVEYIGNKYLVAWRMGAFSNSTPSGLFCTRVSTTGEVLDSDITKEGLSLIGVPPNASLSVHPTLLHNGVNTLLVWNNNTELSGGLKSVHGLFIYPF